MFLSSPQFILVKKILSFIVNWIKKSIFAAAFFVIAQTVQAATFTISTPTTDGTFTLSWSDARTFAELYEVINGSRQKVGGQYPKTHSLSYTKIPGTYTYIVVDVLAYGCSTCPGGTAYNRTEIQRTVVVPVTNVAPAIPATISVIPNNFDESISVSWGQSTGASRYELERNSANVYSGLATNNTQANLQIGTDYTFRVRACNAYGCSDWRIANSTALSETFSVPLSNATGQYSISVVAPPNYSHTRIEERAGISGNWAELTILASSGGQSHSVTRTNGTYYYRLSYCYFSNQAQTCTPRNSERSIVVNQPAPTIIASFSPATINEGGTTVLSWSATNATACSATGISGVSGINGSVNYTASSIMSANTSATVTVNCSGGGGNGSKGATVNINWVNDAPLISGISSRSIDEDASTGTIGFTVEDEETAPASLEVSASSDNQSLIPNSNIQLTNNGSNRTITLVPAVNQSGSAKIALRVMDAHGASATSEFNITVNAVDDAPVISAINNVTINELAETTVNFTVTDIDSSVSGVTVSSNAIGTVTPLLSGSGNSYSVKLTAGTINVDSSTALAQITVQVPFSPSPVTRSFTVNVNNLDPQLWIEETGTLGVYDLHWRLATAAAQIYENGVDITTMMDPSGYAPVSGTKRITKSANGTFNYYIRNCVRATQGSFSCQGAYSPVSKTVTFPAPIVTASFNKTSVNEANAGATNTTADLTWSSTNADSCSASGITGVSATSGNKIYTAPANLVTNQTHKVIVTCTGKGGSAQDDAELTLIALNDSPVTTITSTINAREDEVFYIPFTAADEETTLTVSHLIITSSDPAKVPATNIQVELGATPRLVVTPVPNASGTLSIKLKAKDPGDAESAEVISNITIASVDDAPVISAISNVTMNELGTATVNFTVTDIDSSVSGVTVSSESNTIVTPVLSGSGSSYSIALTAGAIIADSSSLGATITVSAPFSPAPVTRNFTATVNNVNPQLWITDSGTIGVYTLNWKFGTAATKIFQNGVDITTLIDPSGYAPVSGSKQITKTANGTFNYYISDCVRTPPQGTFSCSGNYSPISKTVTFPVPIVTASFNKTSVNEANAGATNTTADLTWSSTNADSCSASGITGVSATSGNKIYTAPANLVTNQTHKVIVTCTGKGGSAQDEAELTLTALNDQPTTSAIVSPVTTNEDEAVSINFTVGDEETLAVDLDVTTTSSNPELIPDSNLQLTANGENRSLAITPLANQFGSAVITVTVKDATLEFSRQFTVNVNAVDDAPVISDIPAITINEGATSEWQVFTVTDSDTASELHVTATANGSMLIPNANILLEREGSAYKIAVKAGRFASHSDFEITTIKIAVSGGSLEPATKSFQVKVNNLPAQLIVPELSSSGIYEVKWDFGTHGVRIFENGADITTLINPSGAAPTTGARSFVKTESGIYNYAIKDCVYGQNGSLVCDHISDSKSVQVSLTAPSAPVLNSPPTSNTGEYVVTWTVIPGVINYRLYENDVLIHNSGSTFKAFQSTNRKGSGTYQYTVKACILSCSEFSNVQTTVVTVASSSSKESSSSFSSSTSSKSSSSASSVNRKVIFIHTDLLGSPAAETNAEGNANE